MPEPLWIPSRKRADATGLARFTASLSAQGHNVGDGYDALWRWSIENQPALWDAVWDWCGVVGDKGDRVVDPGDRLRETRYFPDARLNFAGNLLRRRTGTPAIIARNETGRHRELSRRELHDLTSRLAQAMRAAGLKPGDRIALLLPNIPEAVATALAAASIGAVVSSASPDFGARGVVDRFGQVRPRLLFAADGYTYRGKRYDTMAKVPRILEGLPTVERTIVVPNLDEATPPPAAAVTLGDFIAPHSPADIRFTRLPFDHPLYILFSSGTTGVPKCIVHRAGGVLLQHLKEHQLHCDIRADDRVFYYTTLGWMMWNWLVSALASGATILLYDGSPVHPATTSLFDFAEAAGMTLMGTSPGYLDTLRTSRASPRRTHDLSSLRTIVSTGSPLPANAFVYVYRHVKRDVHLASVSGGTDLCACFVGGVPTHPVHPGEIQGPALGMAADVFDADGAPLRAGKGELVCTRPFPSLPLGFLNDDDGSRYRDTYFDRFPDVWCHGDYIEKTATGGYVIHGRSAFRGRGAGRSWSWRCARWCTGSRCGTWRRSPTRRRLRSSGGGGRQGGRTLTARGQNPPGIRPAMHPRWPLRFTCSRRKSCFTFCQPQYTFGGSNASLCVAPRANSSAIHLSSRLASPAPHRSRCSRGFIHGLLDLLQQPLQHPAHYALQYLCHRSFPRLKSPGERRQ